MNRTVLGIETSCDETAAAVYDSQRGVRSNKLFSQIDLHAAFGGVVPEIASRSHIEKINPIIEQALQSAEMTLDEIDVAAVTNRPGLPGSLLVGVCFAKALAWAKQKKIIGINHLEAHIFSSFLGQPEQPPFPHICLTASGGHSSLYLVQGFGEYELLGNTLDDAAGEAFDKIAKLMHLPYPGGPIIEQLAQEVNFNDFYHYPRSTKRTLNFSFSGLKTAVLYNLVNRDLYDMKTKKFSSDMNDQIKKEVASSLLVCIKDIFIEKLSSAISFHPQVKAITFVGGVACNKFIKKHIADLAQKHDLQFFSPPPQYCTDNAAMVAFVGNYKAEQGKFSDYYLDIY